MLSFSRLSWLAGMGAVAATVWGPAGAQSISATISGEITPGVYGRVQIGNAPPPPLLYAEPVIVHRPGPGMAMAPAYLYVPPGHAKNWPKHCAKYNACHQPVYFVKEPHAGGKGGPPGHARGDDHRGPGRGKGHEDGHGRGKGHGKHDD